MLLLGMNDTGPNLQKNVKQRIALFEENDLTRRIVSKVLKDANYDVVFTENEDHLLTLLKKESFGLVIIGTTSDSIDCTQVIADIREHYPAWSLPIIVMSNRAATDDIDKLFKSGATDFIEKPITWPLLASRVELALRITQYGTEISRNENRLKKAQAMARIGYWHMKEDLSSVTFSENFCNILDIPRGSLESFQDFFSVVHPNDRERFMSEIQMAFIKQEAFGFSHRILMPNGQEFYVTQFGEFHRADDNANELFLTMRDDTEVNVAKENLHKEKYFDTVTGLPNKTHLTFVLETEISNAHSKEKMLSLCFVGLRGFNDIFDAIGPSGSDTIVQIIGERLAKTCDKCIVIARISTDVFALLSDKFTTIEQAEIYANECMKSIAETVVVEGHSLNIKSNAGLSFFPIDAESASEMLSAADTAMHEAKKIGINAQFVHTEKLQKKIKRQLYIESELKSAIENGDLELYYQPQINVVKNTISGMEALVRWKHPERGIISPMEFIEIAEEKGLIVPMGEWVVHEACRDANAFHQKGFPHLRVGINISAKQFNDHHFLPMLEGAISRSGIDPNTLELEITESSAMSNLDNAIKILNALRELGAHTSMDDFGTGFSSLSSLQLLPLNTLKIDKAFVKGIGENGQTGAIPSAILAMAKGLKMETVAEGVETIEQLYFMKHHQCDYIQGYYYSKPLPKNEFSQFLDQYH